jgi:hypothetical protein
MTNTEERCDDRCPLCDLRMSEALTVVSRHRTSTGAVVYARCDCGRLSVWSEPAVLVQGPPELRVAAHAASEAPRGR